MCDEYKVCVKYLSCNDLKKDSMPMSGGPNIYSNCEIDPSRIQLLGNDAGAIVFMVRYSIELFND